MPAPVLWAPGYSAGVSGLQPHPRAAHTPPYSPRAAPRTPPHTPNASLSGVLPTLLRCVCTPKHPRLPVPPDCDPFTASPSTSNTHTPKSPAPTGSPGNTEAPAPAPGPGKSPALQARAPPPPQAPLPLPKVGGHSAVQWGDGPEGGYPTPPFPHKPPCSLRGWAPPGPLHDRPSFCFFFFFLQTLLAPPRPGTHPPLRTAGWARPAPRSARRLCIRSVRVAPNSALVDGQRGRWGV
ncbi:uncharacterized protein [Muntiacus reevesi]|uniref:uncharacterized protein n=1 Tax=Muntiacus reevesi TaxID=9886 RepID=UPI003306F41A